MNRYILGNTLRTTVARAVRHSHPRPSQHILRCMRQYSSSSSSSTTGSEHQFHPYVDSTLQQISSIAPKFAVDPAAIHILQTPSEFYELLKSKILSAKRRVFLSTLYIGKTETDLVECISTALSLNENLEVYILTDALRGTREAPNTCSATLLLPLVEKFPHRVQLSMYHTPHLHGVKKTLLPSRFNEGWGLQHMKLYGFDDEIMLSGANLSNDYFTNRQDRYVLFSDAHLTEYYFKIYQAIAQLSYSVIPSQQSKSGFKLQWPHYYSAPEPTVDPTGFIKAATRKLKPLLGPQNAPRIEGPEEPQTFVYPVCQFTPIMHPDTSTEFTVVSRLLSMLGTGKFNWTLTQGYFNIHPEYREKLLKSKPSFAQIITASPEANGFYKSEGISGMLPGAYSELSRRFLQAAQTLSPQIEIHEWKKGTVNTPGGWSYHAKGLWVSQPGEDSPFLTVIGSSNYTIRAYTHDIEANAVIVTADAALRSKLAAEVANLNTNTKKMALKDYENDETRNLSWHQQAFIKTFIKTMGDKL